MKVLASSFADPADVSAFRKAKNEGKTDQQAFKVGDNGIGCWGSDTSEGSGRAVALPPDDMIEKWGSTQEAKNKQVKVTVGERSTVAILKDRMPWKKNITNGTGIDLNPDTCAALGLKPPIKVSAEWEWVHMERGLEV